MLSKECTLEETSGDSPDLFCLSSAEDTMVRSPIVATIGPVRSGKRGSSRLRITA